MNNMQIAETILQQLGGRRFIAFTGAKNFTTIENGLRFTIGRNASKANRVEIKLNGADLYDYEFIKYSPAHLKVDHRKGTAEWVDSKSASVRKYNDVFFDQLQELFTETTDLYTHF